MVENPTSIKITEVSLRNENKDSEARESLDQSTTSTVVGTRITVPRNTVKTYSKEVSEYLRKNVKPKVKLLDETSLHTAYLFVRYNVEVIRGINAKDKNGLIKIIKSLVSKGGKAEDALQVEVIEKKLAKIKLDDFDQIVPTYSRLIKSQHLRHLNYLKLGRVMKKK